MAAHTGIAGFSDNVYSITASIPTSYDSTGYAATTGFVWTTIDRVETFPEYGEQRSETEFRPISGPVETVKGASDYGGGPMTVGDMPLDGGQVLLKAATSSEARYSMKVTHTGDGEIDYLEVLVSSWRLIQQQEGALKKRTCNIKVVRAPVNVPAA